MKQIFLLLLLLPLTLKGEGDDLLKLGQVSFEVGAYNDAYENYRKALKRSEIPWVRAVIQYNIGTVLLHQGKWNEALDFYQDAQNTPNIPPYLLKKLKINTTIAYIQQSEEILKQEQKPFATSSSRLSNPITLLDAANRSLDEAEEITCSLSLIQGVKICPLDPTIEDIQKHLAQSTSRINALHLKNRLQSIPFKKGLKKLLYSVESLLPEQKLYSETNSDLDSLRELYRQSEPLWQALKARATELPAELNETFRQARKEYRLALNQLENPSPFLENSRSLLQEIIEKLTDRSPLESQLENGIELFIKLLIFQDSNPETIEELKGLFKKLESRASNSKALPYIQKSAKRFEKSLTAEQKMAPTYLLAAGQSLQHALIYKRLTSDSPPEAYLNAAIDMQQDTLDLTLETQQTLPSQNPLQPLLLESQQDTNQMALLYSQIVYETQKKDFLTATEGEICQKKPWAYLMPLFHQGYQRAQEVIAYLNLPVPPLSKVTELQTKVLKLWKNTSHALEETIPDSEVDTEEEIELSQQSPALSQILQTLIELDVEDTPSRENKAPLPGEDKPW